jgi:hypothetical protein
MEKIFLCFPVELHVFQSRETVKHGHEYRGTLTGLRWRGPSEIVNDRPILWSERILHKDCNRKCSVGKRNTGRGSQGAWRQDDLIGGRPPVAK